MQLRRWTIGSAEVFHYFCIKQGGIKSKCGALRWGFCYFFYYAIFLIASCLFSITSAFALNLRWECTPLERYL